MDWNHQDTATAESWAQAGWEVARQRIACSEYGMPVLDEFTCLLAMAGWARTRWGSFSGPIFWR